MGCTSLYIYILFTKLHAGDPSLASVQFLCYVQRGSLESCHVLAGSGPSSGHRITRVEGPGQDDP